MYFLKILSLAFVVLACVPMMAHGEPLFAWKHDPAAQTIAQQFAPPHGYHRLTVEPGSMSEWLRALPLYPEHKWVRLYNGLPKLNQWAQVAVVDIDVGNRDLQQCADAVIRLRAEYLRSVDREDEIHFNFTSGDTARWSDWKRGLRPKVTGNRVTWSRSATEDDSYENFRRYLDIVFMYAGTASLALELKAVRDPLQVQCGDVYIVGGSPGHAVIVVDVAEDVAGERIFMLAQSYSPAQDIHIVSGPIADAWYPARTAGVLDTPEWTFHYEDLRRFRE